MNTVEVYKHTVINSIVYIKENRTVPETPE